MRTVESSLLAKLRDDAEVLADEATNSAFRNAAIVLAALLAGRAADAGRDPVDAQAAARAAARRAGRRQPPPAGDGPADPRRPGPGGRVQDTRSTRCRCSPARRPARWPAPSTRCTTRPSGWPTEQALLRDNINSIFVNLSRRCQALVERQLALIDRLEQDEQDPDQLASLFELDHLATRMRRNSREPAGALRHRPVPPAHPAGPGLRGGRCRGVRGRAVRPDRGRPRLRSVDGPGPRGQRPRAPDRRAAGQRDLRSPSRTRR